MKLFWQESWKLLKRLIHIRRFVSPRVLVRFWCPLWFSSSICSFWSSPSNVVLSLQMRQTGHRKWRPTLRKHNLFFSFIDSSIWLWLWQWKRQIGNISLNLHRIFWTFLNFSQLSSSFLNFPQFPLNFLHFPQLSSIFLNSPPISSTFLNFPQLSSTFLDSPQIS